MSDATARVALRSAQPLVVVEAPAGCGKTFQGAAYAADAATTGRGAGRVLVLTHTHAAKDTFALRAERAGASVQVRTIDSLITEIATAYHRALDLPENVGAWARRTRKGYECLAEKVTALLKVASGPAKAVAATYPIIVCDEHQDATENQSEIIEAFHAAGARLRIFGDPLQSIYRRRGASSSMQRWTELCRKADEVCALDTPHRWANTNPELGEWILTVRDALLAGARVDLRPPLPDGVTVIRANNVSRRQGAYQTSATHGRALRRAAFSNADVLILSAHNSTVESLRSYFARRIPIWEGHVRYKLDSLVEAVAGADGDPGIVAEAFVDFVQGIGKGFAPYRFGNRLVQEARSGCSKQTHGIPATLQRIAREMVDNPDHKGVAAALRLLLTLLDTDEAFKDVAIDYRQECWDAIRLGKFDDPDEGLAEIARRRAWARTPMPSRAISTVHKAKGLECDNVILIACDEPHFRDDEKSRCVFYVGISRAKRSLTLVVPTDNPSPFLCISNA